MITTNEIAEYRNALLNCLTQFQFYVDATEFKDSGNTAIKYIEALLLKYETDQKDPENFTDENAVLAQKFTDEVYRAMLTAVTNPVNSKQILTDRKDELFDEWYEYFYDHLNGDADQKPDPETHGF